ncbi:hypothetical protein, partial [Pseudomonas aeruginosa]|uniref:hypothetical protein n=1 Tax=Pseudomonas aeruginosa TaxID=287 RepID=UPI003CEDE8DA
GNAAIRSRRGKICGACPALATTVVLRNAMISRDSFSVATVPVIYLAAAGLVAIALLLTWRLKKRPPVEVPEAISSS